MNISDAFYKAVHGAVGGCEALAVRMGMSAAVLRNKANPNAAGNVVTLQDADRVMAMTGDHGVLHALAANHGYVCVRVGDSVQASDMAVLEIVTQVWAANGNLGLAVNEALADGRIERYEVERIRTLVFNADRALHELVARLDGMAQG
ncbi:MAG: phage regulatory CII family protein [Burkholderiaceae bacterium]|nr:phage regulatory CII family protein [Burkholderiaceae bacterium]